MADDARNRPGPFDVRTIEQLVALMSKHDLSEIDLRHGEQRINLRRGDFSPTPDAPSPLMSARRRCVARYAGGEGGPGRSSDPGSGPLPT